MKLKADLHIHSNFSHDGIAPIEKIVAVAKARGLDAVAICDHGHCKAASSYTVDENGMLDGIIMVPSAEFPTEIGHILTLFIEKDITKAAGKKNGKLFSSSNVIAACEAANGIAVLAHPFQSRDSGNVIKNTQLGVEAYNARATRNNRRANLQASAAALENERVFTAGSDAHVAAEIGGAYLEVEAEAKNLAALKKAVLSKSGTVCGRRGMAVYSAVSNFNKARRKKEILKTVYRFLRILPIAVYDLFCSHRQETTIMEGKHYVINS